MHRKRFVPSILTTGALAAVLAAGACGGGNDGETRAVADTQTQSARPANQPMTVSGCLKAGEAEGTFVLTAARSAGSDQTATYQLTGASGVDLQQHTGNRVEVTGTMKAQQEIASRTTAVPEEQATGTAGNPKVITATEIEIRQVTVDSVKPLGEKCEM
jgi:hypothetical protein